MRPRWDLLQGRLHLTIQIRSRVAVDGHVSEEYQVEHCGVFSIDGIFALKPQFGRTGKMAHPRTTLESFDMTDQSMLSTIQS